MGEYLYAIFLLTCSHNYPDSKVHGAYMGPIRGRQDPGGPRVGTGTLLSGFIQVFDKASRREVVS